MTKVFWLTESRFYHQPLEDALAYEDFDVESAERPDKSVQRLGQLEVDVILLGMKIPKYRDHPDEEANGLYVLKELRGEGSQHQNTPILIHGVFLKKDLQ